ncbi:hypothetical protein ACGFI8_45565, partial [Dactylosporangium sp. NPDC048998]
GVAAEIAIGISVDEIHRARDADVAYMRNVFPPLELGWRRSDCVAYLERHGLSGIGKSSCLRCPYHDDGFWTRLKAGSPAEWADAVAFDQAIRHGSARATAGGHPLRGQFFLHRQRVPLDQVVLRPGPVDEADGDAPGCGPWTCPHPSETADGPAGAREVA